MKLRLNLTHCYGINALSHEFDFAEKKAILIYAPNGMMKSSLARTFDDYANDRKTTDRIFPDRPSNSEILLNGEAPKANRICVVEPYNEAYKSDRVSTLLVNRELRQQYEEIYSKIGKEIESLQKNVAKSAGVKMQEVEQLVPKDFSTRGNDFIRALLRIEREVEETNSPPFKGVPYNSLFNEKTEKALSDPDLMAAIESYEDHYNKLIDNSTFFKRGIFTHNNAATIAKNLKDNGWFKSGHSVRLRGVKEQLDVEDETQLAYIIQSEKDKILGDEKLIIEFEKIDKKLEANAQLRNFRDFLIDHKEIIPHLKNPVEFKQELWISYFSEHREQYASLVKMYDDGRKEIESIIEQARSEATQWSKIIEIFNKRFNVPFRLEIENQDDVILKSEAPAIRFIFNEKIEGSEEKEVDFNSLIKVLSHGEKRALYILNIIFEIEARNASDIETLFIIDDIADSFDYKNKYAIIHYIKEVVDVDKFHCIILTHNFDFFRSCQSRLPVSRQHCFHASRGEKAIEIETAHNLNNPLAHWRNHLENDACLIAAIPFVRNLAEYSGHSEIFDKLTSFLHLKDDTNGLLLSHLQQHFDVIISEENPLIIPDCKRNYIEMLFHCCNKLERDASERMSLESKIVLSIGTRICAERFLKTKLDPEFVSQIKKNQTWEMTKRFKESFPNERKVISVLDEIGIVTPENIHVNSFMYEPILDLSPHHLSNLYSRTKDLEIS